MHSIPEDLLRVFAISGHSIGGYIQTDTSVTIHVMGSPDSYELIQSVASLYPGCSRVTVSKVTDYIHGDHALYGDSLLQSRPANMVITIWRESGVLSHE